MLSELLSTFFQHSVVAFIIVLGVLIFVHELGHFVTAKMADIEVPRFSIGFGPRVIGFTRGETEYVISLLPLGGYVKMAGMEEMEQIEGGPATVNDTIGAETKAELIEMAERPHRPRDFESKSLPWRVLVISAGVIMNFLFAIFVYSVIAGTWGIAAEPDTTLGGISKADLPIEAIALTEVQPGMKVVAVNGEQVETMRDLILALSGTRPGATMLAFEGGEELVFEMPAGSRAKSRVVGAFQPDIPHAPLLDNIVADGPGAHGGLQNGDLVVEAGGRTVTKWQEFVAVVEANPGVPLPVVVERDGERIDLIVTPAETTFDSGISIGRLAVGVAAQPEMAALIPREEVGLAGAITYGFTQTWDGVKLIADALSGMFSGRYSFRDLGGPIAIGEISGQAARLGMESFLGIMALLSVNLAVLNLLPIPVLDGGHLVFLGIEAVRGRPLSIETRMRATQAGFVVIIMLMVFVFGNDILRLLGF